MKKIINTFHSGINPVLIKEVRQSVRSRFVVGAMMLLLLILVVIAGGTILVSGATRSSSAGRGLFVAVFSILAGAILWFVPVFVGLRMGIERSGKDPDLLFITTLTPGRVVRGKLLVGLVLSLLFVSLSLPFMVFSTLLQGVDQITIFALVTLLFVASIVLCCLAMLLASIPTSRLMRGLIMLAAMGGLFGCTMFAIFIGGSWVHGDLFSFGTPGEMWGFVGAMVVLGLLVIFLAYALTTSLISPAASNRLMPVRIAASLVWLALSPFTLLALIPGDETQTVLWLFTSIVFFMFMMLTAISERDFLPPRVLRNIPKNLPGRLALFPWFSGCASGIAWCLLHLAVAIAILYLHLSVSGDTLPGDVTRGITTLISTFFAYCLLALLLQRHVFKRVPRFATWGLCIFIISMGTLLPFFLQILFTMNFDPDDMILPYGNLIAFTAEPDRWDFFFFGLIAALGLFLLALPNLLMQLDRFRPPAKPHAPAPATSNEEEAA